MCCDRTDNEKNIIWWYGCGIPKNSLINFLVKFSLADYLSRKLWCQWIDFCFSSTRMHLYYQVFTFALAL